MRSRFRHKFNSTFGAVHSSRNYRIYLFGQSISLCGTWMQTVAQAWLVLKITGSGTALGFVVALQFLPVLLFGPWGGVIADRMPKRRLLLITSVAFGLLALLLGTLTATGVVTLWMVYVVALCFGMVTALDNPARQTFVLEMVGREHLPNAVMLNTVNINMARVIGPALAGLIIAIIGIAPCFFLNAASYVAVIVALLMMTVSELRPLPQQPRAKGQLREGFAYVWSSPKLRTPLLMMAIVGTLAYEFQVILPLVAKYTFGGGAATYGIMTGAMGLGAVIGGLFTASRQQTGDGPLIKATLVFGALIIVAALMPSLATMVVAARRRRRRQRHVPRSCQLDDAAACATPRSRVESWRSGRSRSSARHRSAGRSSVGSDRTSAPAGGWSSAASRPCSRACGVGMRSACGRHACPRRRRSSRRRKRPSCPPVDACGQALIAGRRSAHGIACSSCDATRKSRSSRP